MQHLLQDILDWPPAKSIHDVREFFGQANLFRKRFPVSTDASKYAVEATLEQERHQVVFSSHRLSDTEIRWDTGDQELSSFSLALREWNVYLKGKRLRFLNNHEPQHYLQSKSRLTVRQLR